MSFRSTHEEEVKFSDKSPDYGIQPHAYSWFWQSDSDFQQEKDQNKRIWTEYPEDICYLIEEAFLSNQITVDIGNYKIDFQNMMQIDKLDNDKIRRVKREPKQDLQSRFLTELPNPSRRDEKAINQSVENIHNFVDYIMKRTPATYSLYQRLKKLSLDSKQSEYVDIVEGVINCILKGTSVREKNPKTTIKSPKAKNGFLEANKVIEEIKGGTKNLKEFLRAIIKIYAMESFLCYYINELLGDEDWEGLNVLTPYLICLTYSFQIQDYVIRPPLGIKKHFFPMHNAKEQVQEVILYRGTALTEEKLKYYYEVENRNFWWNTVTSTSRSREIALGFINRSLGKEKEGKVGLLFEIRSDIYSSKDCKGIIDISAYTKNPKEQEVILAPATVFHLTSIELNNKIYEIKLKIQKNFEEKRLEESGVITTLQSVVLYQNRAVLNNLTQDEVVKGLQLLVGNRLIERLEIRKCSKVDIYLMKVIESIRRTTNLAKENIELRDNEIFVYSLSTLDYYFSTENLNSIITHNRIVLVPSEDGDKEPEERVHKIKNLLLKRDALYILHKQGQIEESWKRISHQTGIINIGLEINDNIIQANSLGALINIIKPQSLLKSLSLDFYNCPSFTDQGLESLNGVLVNSKNHLEYLSLNFFCCYQISDEGVNYLRLALNSLPALKHLSLDFRHCSQISNEGFNHITQALKLLTSIQFLSINFGFTQVSDGWFESLKEAFKPILSLRFLSLSFEGCPNISDKGLNKLKDASKSLIFLQNVDLNFDYCFKTTDHGFNSLVALFKLTKCLQVLSFSFKKCSQITNNALANLTNTLQPLTTILGLSLNFSQCLKISDSGFDKLSNVFNYLTSLQELSLEFGFSELSNHSLNALKKTFKPLTSLQSLSLKFSHCEGISGTGFRYLTYTLRFLKSLQHLSLLFEKCFDISEPDLACLSEALRSLKSLRKLSLELHSADGVSNGGLNYIRDGLRFLTSLEYLSLIFREPVQTSSRKFEEDVEYVSPKGLEISDEGMRNFTDVIKSLTHLQHLCLGLARCKYISNPAIGYLANTLKLLLSLQYLALDFESCDQLSDSGLKDITDMPKWLSSLQHLSLSFSKCREISDNRLNNLKYTLESLTNLRNLSLSFAKCNKISDFGLKKLSSALISSTLLQHLSLNFSKCSQITEEGIRSLTEALKSLTFLQHLSLNFNHCSQISNDGFSDLIDVFKSLTLLQHLSLQLKKCSHISDPLLKDLTDALKVLSCLQHLSLNFGFSKVSDVGLNNLNDTLTLLKCLHYLCLNFKNCSQISDSGLKNLTEVLKMATNLEHLSLNFLSCSQISEKTLKNLEQTLKSHLLPSSEILLYII